MCVLLYLCSTQVHVCVYVITYVACMCMHICVRECSMSACTCVCVFVVCVHADLELLQKMHKDLYAHYKQRQ